VDLLRSAAGHPHTDKGRAGNGKTTDDHDRHKQSSAWLTSVPCGLGRVYLGPCRDESTYLHVHAIG
jgi:hypothetical protein